MPKGISLHIGLNEVDPVRYGGWRGTLRGCENDASDMEALAKGLGYEASLLKRSEATRDAVLSAIEAASSALSPGDIFLVTYAGHGAQVPDHDGDEDDGLDETWVLYDGQLIDDELAARWTRFEEGVRILVLSDSCHSGTVIRPPPDPRDPVAQVTAALDELTFRAAPEDVTRSEYQDNRAFYAAITAALPPPSEREPAATVRLIGGCQDNQRAIDTPANGLFTQMLLTVWDKGRFRGTYDELHRAIVGMMPPYQTPNHYVIGPAHSAFDRQRPFSIE